MGQKAEAKTGEGKDFKPAPSGPALAVIVDVLCVGTQPGYQGGAPKQQVLIGFELHKRKGVIRDDDGNPVISYAKMNLTFADKATLTKLSAACRGGVAYTEDEIVAIRDSGGFDVEELLGKTCRVSVKHKESVKEGKTVIRDSAEGFAALDAEDDTPPVPVSPLRYWDWTLGEPIPRRPGLVAYLFKQSPEAATVNLEVEEANAA